LVEEVAITGEVDTTGELDAADEVDTIDLGTSDVSDSKLFAGNVVGFLLQLNSVKQRTLCCDEVAYL
jgi:hypothetical protein